MSKQSSKNTSFFNIGIGEVIPSTQEAYREDRFLVVTRKEEKRNLVKFKESFFKKIQENLQNNEQFPTESEVFIFILQYFTAEKEYRNRDVDNLAKTILDTLRGKIYHDDSKVKTLLVGKKLVDHRVSQNFAYIAVKLLRNGEDVDALKISGIEKAVTLFQELKSKGFL